MLVKPRVLLAASVGLVVLVAGSCGVAAPEEAAQIDGRSIPASVVDALSTDEAFAALLGFQASESEAVLPGSTARSVLDFLLQGEALWIAAQGMGLDPQPDESAAAATIEGLQAQGYTFGIDDLSPEAVEVLSRFVVADRALAEAGQDFGSVSEGDLRFAYDALDSSGQWDQTCVTMVGGAPELAEDALAATRAGVPLADLPEEVEGIQLAVDSEVRCATGADLATLPGDLAAEVEDAEIGELVGPMEVAGSSQPLAVLFVVSDRGTRDFEDARAELEAIVGPSLLAVRTARDTEVNPRYGGPVELELVQGQPGPTGEPGAPSLAARVSRPEAPGEVSDVLAGE